MTGLHIAAIVVQGRTRTRSIKAYVNSCLGQPVWPSRYGGWKMEIVKWRGRVWEKTLVNEEAMTLCCRYENTRLVGGLQ